MERVPVLLDGSGNVARLISGVYGTGQVGNITVSFWSVIDDRETANWQNVGNSESAGWTEINHAEDPSWELIGA